MALLVSNIPWPGDEGDPREALAERLGVPVGSLGDVALLKRSVDGRSRPPRWLANYRVEVPGEDALLAAGLHGVRPFTARDAARYEGQVGEPPEARVPRRWPAGLRPIVIGAGPAGLFAALRLGEAGAPAILLERGGPVEERHHAVRRFWRHRELDPETNVVFGEGGAGAFSDGKIYTRRRDGELGWVFRRLVDMGADRAILEEGWAHLGTDRIRELLPRLRHRLGELGVEVRFHAVVEALLTEGQGDSARCVGVALQGGERLAGAPVMVAAGHSARDMWAAMLRAGAAAELRPIHIGARIEHPQRLIDRGRYGGERADLPPASYRLTWRPEHPDGRSAHSFCMCPGGTVVAASNHAERVVVNGMSYSGRRAFYANSAVIVEVRPADYPGTDPLAGMRYQDAIEAAAYRLGGGGFRAPGQRVEDLLAGRESQALPRTSYPMGVSPADLREVLPAPIIDGMIAAIQAWDRKLPGFAGPEGVLIAPETRTTAPLRFLRGADLCSPSVADLMPIGEGAGYAGGIISAALDGFRAANALIERFAPRAS